MKCYFEYNGHKFESEVLLDDFLLTRGKLVRKYGDIVFSMSEKQAYGHDIIKEKLPIAKKIFQKHTDEKIKYDDNDIEYYTAKDGYMGVTEFLSGLEINGKLLFPEFIDTNYFNTRKEEWKDGRFTVDEKELIFGDNPTRPPVSDKEIENWIDLIKDKWKNQGLIGTELHKIGQEYFSLSSNIRHSDINNLMKIISPKINKDLVSEKVLKESIQYYANLEESLNNEFNPTGKQELVFYPEYKITGEAVDISDPNKTKKILGVIDLLVLDGDGNVHIVDYKTSPHDYAKKDTEDGYSTAKILAFKYQLAVYERLLKSYGLYVGGTKLLVAPIQLTNFRKEDNKWIYEGIKEYEGLTDTISKDGMERVNNNLDEIFYEPETTNIAAENLLDSTSTDMSKIFPKVRFSIKTDDIEDMAQKSFKENAFFDKDTSLWTYTWTSTGKKTTAKTEAELYKKILGTYKKWPSRRLENLRRIKNIILEAQKDPENIDYNVNFVGKYDRVEDQESGISSWLNIILKEYINPGWRLIENEYTVPFEHLGMLIFERGNQIDVIKLSTSDLKRTRELVRGRKLITGAFESDTTEQNKPDFIPLDCNYGNMELMEAMMALNKVPELFKNKMLGEIKVINTHTQTGMIVNDNKQLVDNFNELARLGKLETNFFKNGSIKVAKLTNLAYNKVHSIITYEDNKNTLKRSGYQDISATISEMDNFMGMNPEEVKAKLIRLQKQFEDAFPELKQVTKDKTKMGDDKVIAYNYIVMAIAELNGIHWGQILKDHNNYLDSGNFLINGIQGLRYDNPGNTASPFLNSITKMIMNAHQNSRQQISQSVAEIRQLVDNLKKEKSFSYIKERTVGNQADLYKNLYEFRDSNIFFKNPWDMHSNLSNAEREMLKYVLQKINKRKYSGKSESFIEQKRLDSNSEYYWVPLAKGGTNSMVSVDGLLKTLKYKFKGLFRGVAQRSSDEGEGVGTRIAGVASKLFDSNEKEDKANSEIWEMTNRFDAGYSNDRSDIITKRGIGYFEYNLETLFLQHEFAYIQKENIDKIFPDLKAASIYLNFSGLIQNTQFPNIAKYLNDYIKAKVLNKPLVPEKYETLEGYRKMLMSITSKLALAFSPKQLYQHIEGIWKDISLIYRKPDGTEAFTFKNMKDAWLYAYSEMFHYGNGRSKAELINEFYALNDMDVNTYIQRITSDKNGFWHFWDAIAFRFASRPDFYNRMTIFGAQMRADGSWDAHSVVNGKLVYDWKKDKRFDAFANGKKSDPKYKEQEGLYYSMAKQMIAEGTKVLDKNGNYVDFKLSGDPDNPTPLPKAYTTQQSEGYKDLSDVMYGYYSNEKKSLIQSYGLGALFMQMYTYMSGKKTQYFAQSRQSIMGKMVQYEESGQKYWIQLDENGRPTDIPTTDSSSGIPFMVWKGQFHEGIVTTLFKMAREVLYKDPEDNTISISKGWARYKENYLNNKDADLSRAYISNYKQLGYDIFMWMIVGSLLAGSLEKSANDYIKERGNDTANKAVANATLSFSIGVLNHSFLDFNFMDSLFGRGVDWTPFAAKTALNTINYFGSCFAGDETFLRTLAKSMAATRSFKPIWDYYLPKAEKEE